MAKIGVRTDNRESSHTKSDFSAHFSLDEGIGQGGGMEKVPRLE